MSSKRFAVSTGLAVVWCGLVTIGPAPTTAKEKAAPEEPNKKSTAAERAAAIEKDVTQGALRIVGEDATVVECPLKHTDVQADVSGFIARVKVTQTFVNPTKEKIEAVYVFPLPNEAAVDEMTMVIGERRIVGIIKRRDTARQIYEQAVSRGQTAALLEQERPNIFTQSVGNIAPGQEINIEISYIDVLKYDQGSYEFHFPMVVGPRYNPQQSPGRPAVADASKINPPVLKPKERTSHDISLAVNLDAGVPIQNLTNANHKVHTIKKGKTKARVRLLQEDSIPNKDFVLRYDVVGNKPEMAMLAHTGDYGDGAHVGNGYFMLMIQPKEDERLKRSPPREIVFLVDVSGSMSGQPTETTKAAMQEMLKLCREQDTLQVVTFAGSAHKLFDKPVPVNDANIKKAVAYSRNFRGSGGTRMLEGVKMAIDQPIDKKRVRIVVMLTDGYIGNEAQIIEHVGKNCGDQIRFWALGIGSSPNMFLIDGVAKQGGGMGKRLGLNDDIKTTCTEVITRIQRAQLAKIKIDWGDLQVSETYPAKIPELWAGRPVIVYGRYKGGGDSKVSISGNVEGDDVSWPLTVSMPAKEETNDVLAKVWARKKIEDVMHQSYYGGSPAVEEEVTALALRYGLMSQYTSFVAVDEKEAGKIDELARPPRRMTVPVPLPEGTRYEGFFGDAEGVARAGDFLNGDGVVLHHSVDRLAAPMEKAKDQLSQLSRSVRGLSVRRQNTLQPNYANRFGRISGKSTGQGLGGRGGYATRWGIPGGSAPGFGGGYAPGRKRAGYAVNQPARTPALKSLVAGAQIRLAEKPQSRVAPSPTFGLPADKSADSRKALAEYEYRVQLGNAAETSKAAQEAWTAASKTSEKDDLSATRQAIMRAYLLDTAAAKYGHSNGQILNEALAALEKIHARKVEAWCEKQPALNTKLNLVLRDRPLAEALAEIAKAADIDIELLEGSENDVADLLFEDDVRISFLDLRHATAAQALDWLTQATRLSWWLEKEGVCIASERRREGQAGWVYDVSLISLPTAEELGDLKDEAKQTAAVKKAVDDFLATIRKDLDLKANQAVWFAPGQLLIISDAAGHKSAAKLLAELTEGEPLAQGEAAKFVQLTRKRAAQRKELVAKQAAARRKLDVASRHNEFGWRLLAAAAGGELDLEALTELQIAWKDKATAELLGGDSSDLALRSLWMVCEASRALPNEAELTQLAADPRKLSDKAARDAVKALREKPDDAGAFARVLYASLAQVDDNAYRSEALSSIQNAKTEKSGLSRARTILTALLVPRDKVDDDALSKLIDGGVRGNDLTTLLAVACHRAGGDVWRSFRIASEDLVGKQPLRGEAVVIITRVASGQLQVARR